MEENNKMINKKAAMFGLDARIALAIFGALSVITGAALYSAIGKAKATAILTDLTEIAKAYEQFYLDTGVHISRETAISTTYEIKELIENVNSKSGWNGPYISYSPISTSKTVLAHSQYEQVLIRVLSTEDWTAGNRIDCATGKDCALFINLNGIPTDSYAKEIDSQVDGGDGAGKGNFRWWTDSNTTYLYRYEYKIMPMKNMFD